MSGWSTTAGSNATVGSIDWAEGMAPAQVNNSARAMMADQADWYRNSAEWILRTDTPVYVSATSFKFTGTDLTSIYSVGRRIKLIAPTPGTIYGRITASAFVTDTTLTISWDSTSLTNETLTSVAVGIVKNASTGQSLDAENIKRVREFGMPAGAMVSYGSTTAPSGWLLCYGQTVSRTTYADLFAAISTTYGSTDSATFKVPDRRGRVSICLNNLGGSSASTFTGLTTLGATGGSKTTTATGSITINAVTLAQANLPNVQLGAGFRSANNSNTTSAFVRGNQAISSGAGGVTTDANSASLECLTQAMGSGTSFTPTGSFTGNAVNSAPPYMVDTWIIKT